ncbi:MAG: hypothetical protein HBSAPP03_21710 [Phycisphaerae bacterium]|nr:MAG: hypothetical protein HBSAPP03_21710 [Phycisphaerae bacterium]
MKQTLIRSSWTPGCLVLIAGLALASCDRESDTSRAVTSASQQLSAMSGSGSAPAPDAVRTRVYTKVAGELKAGAASGEGAERAAAHQLLAATKIGLGEEHAVAADDVEGTILRHLGAVESAITRWSVASSIAAAAESFDASAQMARVSAAKKDKDAVKARESDRLAALGKQLADLRAKATDKAAQADAKLAEHSRLMGTTTQMSATQAEPIVERANLIRMQGERLRLEAGRLEAEADLIQPQFDEVKTIVAQLTKQRADLDATEADLTAQASAARAEAKAARDAATMIATDIHRMVGEIDRLRSEDLAAAYDKADRQYGEALAAAREASKEPRSGGGKASLGAANLALAESAWRRATGTQAYLRTLRSLATVQPALPNAASYRSALATLAADRKASLEKATESLGAARDAFAGVQAAPAVRERVDALTAMLDDAKKLANNERLDASSPLAPPAWLRSAESAPGATPQSALDDLLAGTRSLAKAERACQDKFGKGMAAVLSAGGGMGAMIGPMLANAGPGIEGMSPDALASITADDFTWNVTGNTATATYPGVPEPIRFTKKGDRWTLDLPGMSGMPISPEMMASLMQSMMAAVETWAGEVESGTYQDEAAAGQGFMKKLSGLGGMFGGFGG